MPIQVNNLQQSQKISDAIIKQVEAVLEKGLSLFNREDAEVSLVLVNNDYIQELNLEYRDCNQVTDVLSFALEEESEESPTVIADEAPELLGDIYISVERAAEQAVSYEHSFARELAYLALHGLLHLLGFDHQTPEATAAMREAEEKVLAEFALGRNSG